MQQFEALRRKLQVQRGDTRDVPFTASAAAIRAGKVVVLSSHRIGLELLDTGAIVAHVLVHEIGHHFGLSDDDMEAIEQAAG
jgi:hypothetical protein